MDAPAFTPETEHQLGEAAQLCASRGQRLTAQRRLILGLILDSPKPSGAYDLLDRLAAEGQSAAPPTVYRALDFLTQQGLVHRIERLSAFIGCAHLHASAATRHDHAHDHPGRDHGLCSLQFLICTGCRRVFEITDGPIRDAIESAARETDFRPASATVEIEGLCAECAAARGENPALAPFS